MAAVNAVRRLRGSPEVFAPPPETAHGALLAYLSDATSHDFQPQNVTFAYVAALATPVRDKRERRRAMAERALGIVDAMAAALSAERLAAVGGQATLAQKNLVRGQASLAP
jgi:methylenetetrahydrofolate--tRNA-(uracil-5-)-methyltransferase